MDMMMSGDWEVAAGGTSSADRCFPGFADHGSGVRKSTDPGVGIKAADHDDGARQDDCRATLRGYLAANYERLHRRLAHYLGCPDQASDSLHDAWIHLGKMALPPSVRYPEAYVYRVACNLAIDRLRHERNWMPLDELPEHDIPADPQPGPQGVAEARSELAALERSLSRLPFRHQAVLFDLRVEERSRSEVANRFGLSLRRLDTVLRHTLDHCAKGRTFLGSIPAP